MAFKIPKQPKSVMGFMTPLHRLSEAQKLAEIRARTNGDSHRASLEAAFDFFTDRDAAAAAEGPGNGKEYWPRCPFEYSPTGCPKHVLPEQFKGRD